MKMDCPVMNLESSEARKSAMAAISSAVPNRFMGMTEAIVRRDKAGSAGNLPLQGRRVYWRRAYAVDAYTVVKKVHCKALRQTQDSCLRHRISAASGHASRAGY